MTARDLDALIGALSELYQPVYGHPGYDGAAARPSTDRLAVVAEVVTALQRALDRPVRVLDLGCAQGYFSLSLAALGAQVCGVDREPENIALCRALAAEQPDFNVRFVEGSAEQAMAEMAVGEYDIVLALNVLHHLCHERGLGPTVDLLRNVADKVEVLLAETALHSEPLYWAPAQPDNPRDLLVAFAFAHQVAHVKTHLSSIARPMFFASNRWLWLDRALLRIESWTQQSHELVGDFHQGSRRYFFCGDRMAKYFALTGEAGERNRKELARESAFLESPPAGLARVPRLYAHALDDDFGWLLRELIPGRRLSELMTSGEQFDRMRIVRDVIDELCALEAAGLYHADLRIWNVIVDRDGRSHVIDYGDITNSRECEWPGNVFLSFIVFVYELQRNRLPRVAPTRVPRFAPEHFEEPYRSWIAAFWGDPPERWSFARLRDLLHEITSGATVASGPDRPPSSAAVGGSQWAAAIEKYLDVLGMEQQHILGTVSQREDVVSRLTTERLSIQSALEAERSARASSERMAAALASQVERLQNDVAERDRAIEESRLANASLLEAASEHEKRLGEETRARASAEQRAAALERDANHWWRATAQLTEELRLVYSTLSWRITAPLRWVKGLFRSPAQNDRRATAAPWRPGLQGAVSYVGKRPRLRSWIGARLDRFPTLKQRLKRLAVEAGATPTSVATQSRSQANGVEIGRTARDVHDRLRAALDRRHDRDKDVVR